MATLSLRTIAQSCLGVTGSFSVNTDVYGYVFRNGLSVFGALAGDVLPGSGQPTARSLRQHLTTISGKSIDLVVILVGYETDSTSSISVDDLTKIQYAIQVARDLYAQAPLGIRRLNWQRISNDDAGGYVDIADADEAEDLTDDWNGPNGGIDVFFVRSIGDAAGWSTVNGPCDKDSKFDQTGVVIALSNSKRYTGIALGHEVGHYLGLKHTNSIANMMGADTDDDGIGETDNNSTNIPPEQRATMREHCSVNEGC